jgi:hypothetical protein
MDGFEAGERFRGQQTKLNIEEDDPNDAPCLAPCVPVCCDDCPCDPAKEKTKEGTKKRNVTGSKKEETP